MVRFYLTDVNQIVSDPVRAVGDAVDEVSSLLHKFHGAKTLGSLTSISTRGARKPL